MKKLLILSAATFILTAANAQSTDVLVKNDITKTKTQEMEMKKEKKEDRKVLKVLKGATVSYDAKQSFAHDFVGVTAVKWHRSTNFDEAIFAKGGKMVRAYYDDQANLVGTTYDRSFNDIPSKAQQYIKKKYPDYKVQGVIFYDDNEANQTDMVMYGQQFDDEDTYMIELQNAKQTIVLHVDMTGDVGFFTKIK